MGKQYRDIVHIEEYSYKVETINLYVSRGGLEIKSFIYLVENI